jgi:AraC-like DNA-binding protein
MQEEKNSLRNEFAFFADWVLFVTVSKNEESLVRQPLPLAVPEDRVVFAESVHGQEFEMAWRTDAFAKIIYVVRGEVGLELADGTVTSGEAGAVFAVDSGVKHRLVDRRPATLLLLALGETFLAGHTARAALWKKLPGLNGINVRYARKAPNAAFEKWWRTGLLEQLVCPPGWELQVLGCADQIFLYLGRWQSGGEESPAGERVVRVLREVEQTFPENWDIERARARAGLSRHYFTKLFREETGMSFVQKLTEVRLEHAALLLRQGGHSIAGAAFVCGFNDLSHFYRVFNGRYGVPPGKWSAGNSG